MANRTGIELLPSVCRIVGVSTRTRMFGSGSPDTPRVRVFHEIPYSAADPGSLTAELRPLMKGLERRAAVAVWGLRASHQALLLPPASPADLETLARREARTAPGGAPSDLLADAIAAGEMREGRREVGYVAVPAEELRSRLKPLVDAGFTVASALTPAQAHASLVRQRRALLPDAVVAVLSVNGRATGISVVHGPVVLFARELPWGDDTERLDDDGVGSARAALATRLASELRRSLVYLRQSHKVDVTRVLVCGDVPDVRALTGPLMSELSLDVETLDVGDDLDLAGLPEPADAFTSRLGAWRTAIAISTDPKPLPALQAAESHQAGGGSRLARRLAAAALAGVLIVAAGWGLLSYLSNGATARQQRLRRTIASLEPELQRQDEERRQATVAAAREAAMRAFASQGPRLALVLDAFSQAAPADLALSSVRAEPAVASWRITAEGEAEGPDAASAQETLNRFLKALAASPLLGRPVAPASLRVRTPDPPAADQRTPAEAPPAVEDRPPQPVETRRPAAAGPAYIEVARDGRLYRIPLRRQAGNLEADRQADAIRRQQQAASARQPQAAAQTATAEPPARHPASVIEFTLRYEVPK